MKNNKGFSLVELIVVIAIMAILAAVAIPTFAHFITKANEGSDADFYAGIEYAVDVALAGEGLEAEAITIVVKNQKVTDLSVKINSTTTYVVVTSDATNSPVTDNDVVDDILEIIDLDYEVKTTNTALAEGKVTVSFPAN